jgi:hypothetical protein
MKVVRLSALHTGLLYPHEIFLVLITVRGLVHLRTLVRPEGFIHSVFCLTTGRTPPPKRFLHTVRSRASSFKWEYPLLSLRSSSSFLRLLPRLLVTSNSPFYVNEKFQWHHRESNPRPSGLYRIASTNCATACPLKSIVLPRISQSYSEIKRHPMT